MANVGNVRLDTKELDALARGLRMNTQNAIAAIARQVEAQTKSNIITKDVIDTGAYLNSIMSEEINRNTWHVHDGVEYGIYQELGTHKVSARPTMTPAVETVSNQVEGIIKKELFS